MIAPSELRRIEKHLLPTIVVARARAQSRSAFARGYSGTLVLLVRVDDPDGDLRTGLSESTSEIPPLAPTRDQIGFATLDPTEVQSTAPPPPQPLPSLIDHVELRRRLIVAPHFAVGIRKRDTEIKQFEGKVSVGRARNNDIVLRHATVSKFHAWFTVTGGHIQITDARSKNRTWLGTDVLRPNEPKPVEAGVAIRFGRVSALVVSADTLWRATVGTYDKD